MNEQNNHQQQRQPQQQYQQQNFQQARQPYQQHNYQQARPQQPQPNYQQPRQHYQQQNIHQGFQPQGYPQQGYPQQAYGYSQQGYPQQPQFKKGSSIAALVLGILGIIGAFIPVVCYFTLALSILGIIFGVNGQKKAKAVGTTSGLATAGLVCGIIGTAFSSAGVICVLACAGSTASWLL